MICVYIISNSIDNRIYIGSSVNVKSRLTGHKKDLIKGSHHNSHLQNFANIK